MADPGGANIKDFSIGGKLDCVVLGQRGNGGVVDVGDEAGGVVEAVCVCMIVCG